MQIIALSLAHLGLGMLLTQAFVGVREVGRGFFTLCGWCGVALTGLGWALVQPAAPGVADPAEVGATSVIAWQAAGVACLCFAIGWCFLRARWREAAGPLLRAAGAIAAVALCAQGWALARLLRPDGSALVPALTSADFLLSAGVLGGVTVAMILGHWYLVQPGLEIEPLARLSGLFIMMLVARLVMESAAIAGAAQAGWLTLSPPPGEVLPFPVIVLVQRMLFGFLGPLILAPLVWKTVAMRSTMSATGLLYVAVALVWVGEFLSKYLLLPLRMGA